MSIFRPERTFFCFEEITPSILKRENVKLLICDLDNTLRLHKHKQPEKILQDWVKTCKKAGVKLMVFSNNGRKKMMQEFCRPLNLTCVWWAAKPFTKKLERAIKENQIPKKEIVMLGDKIMTDVLGAHFAGIRAWKVEHRKKFYD